MTNTQPSPGRKDAAQADSAGSASPGAPTHATGPQNPVPPLEVFPRCPAETPRAFSAFVAYFHLGHGRSLSAVADKLGESHGTVRNWASRFDWAARLQDYNSGLLQENARRHAADQLQQAADWNRRLAEFREQEWDAAQKLVVAARCFLEGFGEDDVQRMTLSQVARALRIASTIARSALLGAELPETPETGLSPLQQQLLTGLTRLYGSSAQPDSPHRNPDI